MTHDSLGNVVTLYAPSSLEAVNDFVEGLIACEARVVNILQVARTDGSALVQACCAALHLPRAPAAARSPHAPLSAHPRLRPLPARRLLTKSPWNMSSRANPAQHDRVV